VGESRWHSKMEATCSSETSVDFQQTTRRYSPEDRTHHNHRCENLTTYIESYQFYRLLHIVLRGQRSYPFTELLSLIKTKIIICFFSSKLNVLYGGNHGFSVYLITFYQLRSIKCHSEYE
jgi:hypothetical protein